MVDATRFWVHGCEPGRVSDGSRPALCQTLSIECRSFISFIFLWPVYFVIPVPISLSFVCLCFSLLSLELGRCSSDLFSVQQTTYRIGNHVYYWVWLRPDRLMWRKQQQQQQVCLWLTCCVNIEIIWKGTVIEYWRADKCLDSSFPDYSSSY